ncbi:TNF receptor-associated factor 3 [Rhipicephalus sanguineus]|uniref:TNF receptor-associated factor 3 n=1 Tax=Rhipicephalus sanguineus TaxID=34632 RepID=UPI0020C4FC02|nr:TNF receptor-associated factor 3 [Rhipicephalus sanguineus]
MADIRRVHRFRDHPIAGVNWRPTRFVDELPSSRVCGLCRMIPTRTVLLPCSHILCQSCHAASPQGGSRLCPLDQEPFEEAECTSYALPVSPANALKVYCWNEAHGCEYEGAMEEMLQHFEKECTFHVVECFQCGEAVLHRELATHYVTWCSVGVSSALRDNTSSEYGAVTIEDLRDAIKVVRLLSYFNQVLPAVQSQMNELTEEVTNQESRDC